MQNLKNIFVGFSVSFLGSIPLGYLNVVGFQVFQKSGLLATVWYLLGVICIEFFVIYFTLIFANKLASNEKLTKYIEGFSVIFMFVLAYIFYASATSETNYATTIHYTPFVLGIALSCLNFIQIPFWTSWNLYLLNGKYIEISNLRKYFYVLGTIAGTFCGMLVLIFSLNYLALEVEFFKLFLFRFIIPIVFVGLGIFQGYKFYRKVFR